MIDQVDHRLRRQRRPSVQRLLGQLPVRVHVGMIMRGSLLPLLGLLEIMNKPLDANARKPQPLPRGPLAESLQHRQFKVAPHERAAFLYRQIL